MGAIAAIIVSIAEYASLASTIVTAAIKIGGAVDSVAELFYANIKNMLAEDRGPNAAEMDEINKMMQDQQAALDDRAAEAQALIDSDKG